MGSDHRPMVLNLRGLKTFKPGKVPAREVWDISNIPLPEDDWSWVLACRDQFTKWIEEAGGIIKTLDAANAESQRLADILDWSFQCALDEVAYTHLGTKFVRNRPTPGLDATTKLLIQQEQVAKEAMRMVYDQPGSTEGEKKRARKQLLAASRAVMSAAMRKREVAELTLFRDVEANQGDSKLFWGRFKRLRGTTRINKSPPPSQPTTREKPSLTRWRSFVFGDGSVLTSPLQLGMNTRGGYLRRRIQGRGRGQTRSPPRSPSAPSHLGPPHQPPRSLGRHPQTQAGQGTRRGWNSH